MKRFYKAVAVAETADGFTVHLDGRPVRTPASKPLVVPKHARLIQAVADEWQAQEEFIRPSQMPMTQLAATALDRITGERQAILDQLTAYAQTDLVCYRVQTPVGLRRRQDEGWQPLLDWLKADMAAELQVTDGILAVEQSPHALATVRGHFDGLGLWHLTAAQAATAAAGSAVLGLALAMGRLTGQQVYDLSQIDDAWQVEQWGEDDEATQRRRNLHNDILSAARLLDLLD